MVIQILNAVLIFLIVGIIITGVWFIFEPRIEKERFSEFYILGENQTATEYPDHLLAGQNFPIFIGVGNHEKRPTSYTIEIWTLHTDIDNTTNATRIISEEPIDHISFNLLDNTTSIIPYNLSVKRAGYYRLEFLLFNNNAPSLDVIGEQRINASYRELNLWVTVVENETGEPNHD